MRVLYGTTNPGKLESMKRITEDLGMEIIGLRDLKQPLPIVNETGRDPLENARLKANTYYKAFKMPVFSCDSGLYFEGLEEALQPGIHVRRVDGRELTDDEMIDYYSGLAARYDNQLIGRYKNAICFILDEDHVYWSMEEALATEPFQLVSVPHEKRIPGFPLDALSVDMETGKYYFDLPDRSVDDAAIYRGLKNFFAETLFGDCKDK